MERCTMMQFSLCYVIIVIVVLLASALVWADDQIVVADFSLGVDAQGVPKGWQLKEKSGQADCSVVQVDGLHALLLRSANTSFSIQKEVKVDVKQYPILSWKWKVTELPKGGDFRKSKTDDQAAQLFLAFTKTKAIVYIWDTTAPQGLMDDAPAPPFMSIKAVVVRSGPAETGKWMTETRNVYEDYQKLYGDSAKPLVVSGMRIQINSQHTKTSAESYFAEVMFQKQ
jgi:hypothetical protein